MAVAEADKSSGEFLCRAEFLGFFSLGVLGAVLAYRADMPHSQYADDAEPSLGAVTKILPPFERRLRAEASASPVGYGVIADCKLPIADGASLDALSAEDAERARLQISPTLARPPKKLEQRLADAVRARGYSLDTERAYWLWTRQFILHFEMRHPQEMGDAEVQEFLSHLAVDRELGASSIFAQALKAHISRLSTRMGILSESKLIPPARAVKAFSLSTKTLKLLRLLPYQIQSADQAVFGSSDLKK